MYDMLFSPMSIGNVEIENRIVMTSAEFSLGEPSGKVTPRLSDYYEERAKGGVGLIIPGICRVNDMTGAATYTQLSMSHDYHIEPMREMVRKLHSHGAKLAIQLHHAGRQGYGSTLNSLPLVIPISERVPRFMDLMYKCTPLLLGLEAMRISFPVQAPENLKLTAVYPVSTATNFFNVGGNGIDAGRPFPVQKAELVADRMIDGIERAKKHIYPCKVWRPSKLLMGIVPPVKSFYCSIEKNRLKRFLKIKEELEKK